ncbi:MAG: chloride channel protein, partial [Pseudomonadota bacterium]
ATIAAYLENQFNLSPSARRTLLACGAAAGVSASFNAPIAGVLFAHEIILTHYAFRALVPTIIASVLGAVVARIHLGNFPAFSIPDYQITSYWEFPAFALLGLTCAVAAILFQLSLMATERVAWRINMPLWQRCGTGGFLVGLIGIFFPQVLGIGYDATDQALSQSLPLTLLLALIVAKTAATAISLASRFAGGIFSPTLYLGAMTGAAFGSIATSVFPEVGSSEGLYAILGMGAVAAAVLGAPLSTTMIVFELTSGYSVTIALLLTVSISVGLTQAVLGQSFFHWQLGKRGLFLTDGPHQTIMRRLQVKDFMVPRGEADPEELMPAEDGKMPPWLLETDNLDRALRLFAETGQSKVAVVSPDDETVLIGWADRLSALSKFNRALIDANVEQHR